MKIDMEEIGRMAEVTRQTVSYVLNDKWKEKRISKGVRDKIFKIAKEVDYHPNVVARGLATNRTQNIGVAVSSIEYLTEMYFGTIMQGIAHQVGLHDYNMQFEVTDLSSESAKNLYFIKKVKEKSVDGIIIIDQAVSDSEIIRLKELNMPFVLVDRYIPNSGVCCVRVDNRKGIYMAAENLIKKGHKRIAFVCEYMKWNKTIDMLEGYYQALKEYGISVDKEIVRDSSRWDVDNGIYIELENILKRGSQPTAMLCSSDLVAVQVLRILREMEIMVPQDIALAGYNDDPNFAHVEPQFTTVRVPLKEMGEESARMLFSLIDGEVPGESEVILEPSLIVRQSTEGYTL